MKKFLPTLIIACAVFLAGVHHPIHAKSLSQKEAIAKENIQKSQQKVNVNVASASELQRLKGIGAKKAADIIAYRKSNGNFSSLMDLTKVKGIGVKMVEKLKQNASVK